MERLNKVLAHAGVASRRGADQLIEQGRVSVNGEVVREMGLRVDPAHDSIKVDGRRVGARPRRRVYYMGNKPRGMVTTLSDPEGRPTVRELLKSVRERVYPVGRLDFNSEGLLLFTNDGELARDLMHPRSGVTKTYAVKVRGVPSEAVLERLRRGVVLDGRRTAAAAVILTGGAGNKRLEVQVTEGRKHQVRRMLAAVGHPVAKLRRIRYAGLWLGDLVPGAVRKLSEEEVSRLRRAVAKGGAAGTRRRRPGKG